MAAHRKANVRLAFFFPWFFQIPAVIGLGISFLFILENIYGSIAGIVFTLFVLTCHYRFVINADNKEYHHFLWVFGFRIGKPKKYESIDHLGLVKQKISRTYNSRGSTSTIVHTEFEGYVLFSDSEKVNLYSGQSRKKVLSKMNSLSQTLGISLKDLSE